LQCNGREGSRETQLCFEEAAMRKWLCGVAAVVVLLTASAAVRAADEKGDKKARPAVSDPRSNESKADDNKGKAKKDDDKDEKGQKNQRGNNEEDDKKAKGKKDDDKDEKKGKGDKKEDDRPAAVLTIDLSKVSPDTAKKIVALLQEDAKKAGKKEDEKKGKGKKGEEDKDEKKGKGEKK
jgi:Ca-activated chloride channel family protein